MKEPKEVLLPLALFIYFYCVSAFFDLLPYVAVAEELFFFVYIFRYIVEYRSLLSIQIIIRRKPFPDDMSETGFFCFAAM